MPRNRLRMYHVTSPANAEAILRSGFRDAVGYYLTADKHTGVWLSDVPLSSNEGAIDGAVLEVVFRVDDAKLARYEWIEDGKPYREWLIPAARINGRTFVRMLKED